MNGNSEQIQSSTLSEDRQRRRRAIEEDTATEDEARRTEGLIRDRLRTTNRMELTP